MGNVKIFAVTLSAWCAVTFVLCVVWCGIAPEGWQAREFLELSLPGFLGLSPASFALGLAESAAFGAYAGALLAALHSSVLRFERRSIGRMRLRC